MRSAIPPEFLLLSTAFVWGGYHPCMRMLLTDTSERGSAPTPSEINLARFSLVAALFVAQAICADAACFRRRARSGGASLMTTREEPFGFTRSLVSAERGEEKRRPPGETFGKLERAASLDNKNAAFLWGAACELAFWHFVTIALQSTGVAFVGATRAGFIAASTTMTVPFVSALFGESVSTNTWIAAFVSMAGAALIVFSSTTDDDARVSVGNAAFVNERFHQSKRFHNNDGSRVFLGDDALTSAGSVAWAVFLFRLSRLAPRFPRLPLAVARSACMTLFVAAWWLVDTLARSRSNHAQSVSIEAYERETEGGEKPFRWLASPRGGVDGVHGDRPGLGVRVVASHRAGLRLGGARRRAHVHDAAVGRGVGGGGHGRDHGLGGLARGSDRRRRHRARRARSSVSDEDMEKKRARSR